MRKSILFAVLASVCLAGCLENRTPLVESDPQLRRQIFKECMSALPAGPKSTVYNDWAEVVDSCDSAAYYQSKVCVANCRKS